MGAPAPDLAEVRRLVAPRLGLPWAIDDLRWSSCFTLHHMVVPLMATGRVFLAGDAAHCSSLFGGFGMNGGIQDACNLAWKLAAVHHGWGTQALLDTYQAERHPEAARYVALANTMHVELLGGADTSPVTLPLPPDPAEANALRMMLDVQYRPGPAVADASGGPVPGTRFADPDRLERSGTYELLVGDGAVVPAALTARWARALGRVVVGGVDGGAVLVRPDGVVGWSRAEADDAAWAALDRHLAGCLRPG